MRRDLRAVVIAAAIPLIGSPGCADPTREPLPSAEARPERPPKDPLSAGALRITDVALNQAVRRPLVVDRESVVDDVPVIGGREALMRVSYEASDEAVGREIEVELRLGDSEPFVTRHVVSEQSRVDLIASTANFTIPGPALAKGTVPWRITARSGGEVIERFPDDGEASLAVDVEAPAIELVFLPLRYTPTDSLADVGEALAFGAVEAVYRRVPAREVRWSVAEPLDVDVPLDIAGGPSLLESLVNRRQLDGATDEQFYVGLFDPGAPIDLWCGDVNCVRAHAPGCVEGDPCDGFAPPPPERRAMVVLSDGASTIFQTSLGFAMALVLGVVGKGPCSEHEDWGYDLLSGVLYAPDSLGTMRSERICQGKRGWPAAASFATMAWTLDATGGGR